MLTVCLVLLIVIGLLFMYYVFFAKKNDTSKEKMTNGMKIVNYNTEWCGFSKRFQPIWDDFTKDMKKKYSNIEVIDMKCDKDENKDKCMIPEVEGFPTVILHKDGKSIVYEDSRNKESIMKFIEANK
jgi:hypothetical protein